MDFQEGLKEEEPLEELSREEILDLNKIKKRYSRRQIEEFISSRMKNGVMEVTADTVKGEEDFEKLILAYDYSIQKKSVFCVEKSTEKSAEKPAEESVEKSAEKPEKGPEMLTSSGYRYPKLTFKRRRS